MNPVNRISRALSSGLALTALLATAACGGNSEAASGDPRRG
ncbi:hypothetical protein SVIOM74S_06268 [Streptomyces violarus]